MKPTQNPWTIRRVVASLLSLLLLLSNCFVDAFKYGPSIAWLASSRTVLKLSDFPSHSVLVPLMKNNVSAYGYELFNHNKPNWMWRENEVFVKVPKGFRVMIVIQMLNLSQGIDEELEKGLRSVGLSPCSESLQIYEDNELIQETCGTVDYTDKLTNPKELVGARSFISNRNSVKLVVQFANKLLTQFDNSMTYWDTLYKKTVWNRKFSLALSLTAFKDCEEISTLEKQNLRPCHTNVMYASQDTTTDVESEHSSEPPVDTDSTTLTPCIHRNLFCDGIMNCAVPRETFLGNDEDLTNCPLTFTKYNNKTLEVFSQIHFRPNDYYTVENVSTTQQFDNRDSFNRADFVLNPSSTILLIILTVLFVMILGLVVRLCCTKCAGTPLPRQRRSNTSQSVEGVWDITGDPYLPNFVVQSQCSRFEVQKDLPPPYESLFPSIRKEEIAIAIQMENLSCTATESSENINENNICNNTNSSPENCSAIPNNSTSGSKVDVTSTQIENI